MTSKLKGFASFRQKNTKNERKIKQCGNNDRRKSISAVSKSDFKSEQDFLTTLRQWKEREDRGLAFFNILDKRKSASLSGMTNTLLTSNDEQLFHNSTTYFSSDGNLTSATDSTTVKSAFVTELKSKLALRTQQKVEQVVVNSPDDDNVTLRRQSSQLLRIEQGRSKTCFLYPGSRTTTHNKPSIVKQGPIERAKIGTTRRGGLPKHWSRSQYACLRSDGRLHLSENSNAALEAAVRPQPLDANTALVNSLDITGSRVTRGSAHSQKKNVIELVSNEGQLILLQIDDSNITEEWYEVLSNTAGPPKGGSLPRVKSMKLADNPQSTVHDTTIRSTIGKLFSGGKRPTREFLERRGIYRNEPVFGNSLEALCAKELGNQAPTFVKECINVLGAPPHIYQIGLYRTSGNLSHIQRLRLQVDQGDVRAVTEEKDTDVLAGGLKLFFRELRDPLIPYQSYIKLVAEAENNSEIPRVKKLLCNTLPASHLATLGALCRHLAQVCAQEKLNQMNEQSMAIVWGPSLTWPDEASHDAILQCTRVNRLIEYLIVNEKALF